MSEIDDRWRTGLQAEAVTIDLHEAVPAERVMRRARRRVQRRRAALGTVAAGVLVAGGLTWQANRAGQRERAQDLVVSNEPEGGTAGVADGGAAPPAAVPSVVAMAPGVGPYAVDPATLPDVTMGGAGLSWQANDVKFGKGLSFVFGSGLRAGTGGLVGVSTAPGVTTGDYTPGTVYTSADGVTWNGVASNGSHWFGDITTVGDRLVAVGTAAATGKIENPQNGGVGDVVVAVSDDHGTTWRDIVLPVDLRGAAKAMKAKGMQGQVSLTEAKVAAGAKGWLVAVSARANVDGRALMPSSVDTTYGYAFTYDGVVVFAKETDPDRAAVQACMYGSTGCDGAAMQRMKMAATTFRPTVDHVYTWSELGVDATLASLMGGSLRLFHSTDGEQFTEIAAPDGAPGSGGGGGGLIALADGFALAARNDGCCSLEQVTGVQPGAAPTKVWRTSDLTTWQALDPVPLGGNGYAQSFGELGGRLAVAGSDGLYPVLAVADGTTWTVTRLGKAVAARGQQVVGVVASVGAAGVAFGVSTFPDPWAAANLSLKDRGLTLRVDGQQRGFSIVDDASGAVLGQMADLYNSTSNEHIRMTVGGGGYPGSPGGAVPTTAVGAPVTYPDTTVVGPTRTPLSTAAIVSDAATLASLASTPTTLPVGAEPPTITRQPLPVSTPLSTLPLATTPTMHDPSSAYEVKAGDIAVRIANAAGVTLEDLAAANAGVDLDKIIPGQRLVLPPGAAVVTGAPPVPQDPPGPTTLTVTDAKTGDVLATFAVAELQQRLQQLMATVDYTKQRSTLLFSRDGTAWSLSDLSAAAGTDATLQNLVVTADRVIATVRTGEKDPDAPKQPVEGTPPLRKQKVLVGTVA